MIPGILGATGRFLDVAALSNCALWLDASDASTITHSSGSVSQINDKSGNSRHFTQGTSTNQPRIDTHTQNGLAVLDFDGTNDRLELGSSGLGRNVGGVTIYVVAKPDSISAIRTLLQFSSGSNSSQSRSSVRLTSASKAELGGRRLDANSFASTTGASNVSTSTFSVFTGVLDYTNSDAFIYLGQSLDGSTTSFQTDGSTSDTDSLASRLGSSLSSLDFFDGQIAELIVFHAAHNADQRALIWSYLNRKWGLS